MEVNSSSAKFSRPTSVILVTKSGSNDIHGSLFETNRDYGYGVARARDNFTNTAAKLIRNEYGGTVGGPVFIPKVYNGKNRSFWFFSYEGFKQRTGSFGNYQGPHRCHAQRRFLGTGELGGDPVSHLRPAHHAVRGEQLYPRALHLQRQAQHHRPGADQPADEIPLQHPAGAEHTRRESADLRNNYSAPNPNIQNQYTYSMRFDQRFIEKDLVYGRITKADGSTVRPAAGGVPTLDGFGNSRTDTFPNESLSLDWTHTISPDLRQRVHVQRQPDGFDAILRRSHRQLRRAIGPAEPERSARLSRNQQHRSGHRQVQLLPADELEPAVLQLLHPGRQRDQG